MVQDDEFQQQIKALAEPRPHCRAIEGPILP